MQLSDSKIWNLVYKIQNINYDSFFKIYEKNSSQKKIFVRDDTPLGRFLGGKYGILLFFNLSDFSLDFKQKNLLIW